MNILHNLIARVGTGDAVSVWGEGQSGYRYANNLLVDFDGPGTGPSMTNDIWEVAGNAEVTSDDSGFVRVVDPATVSYADLMAPPFRISEGASWRDLASSVGAELVEDDFFRILRDSSPDVGPFEWREPAPDAGVPVVDAGPAPDDGGVGPGPTRDAGPAADAGGGGGETSSGSCAASPTSAGSGTGPWLLGVLLRFAGRRARRRGTAR